MKWQENVPFMKLKRKKITINMNIVDLHVHSNKSDGSLTPCELVDYAIKKKISAFALTDHDTVDGIKESIEYAVDKPIQVIPGIELSSEYEGKDIHIVGLMIDYKSNVLKENLKQFVQSRENRNEKMCNLLTSHGIPITYHELQAKFKESVITRAHYARYMLDNGYIKSLPEAFEKYIGDYAPCYVPREKIAPTDAISLILRASGIPILAHPLLYHMSDERLQRLIAHLKEAGLVGLEAIYTTHSPADTRKMKALAKQNNLDISGGSDFHGAAKPRIDLATGYGNLVVPEEILTNLLKNRRVNNE